MIRSNVVTGVMSFAEMDAMMYKIEGEEDMAELVNGATGESILSMGQSLPSVRRRGTIDVTPSVRTINEAISNICLLYTSSCGVCRARQAV